MRIIAKLCCTGFTVVIVLFGWIVEAKEIIFQERNDPYQVEATEPDTRKLEFFVATDGDDGNDGSIEKPFRTIEKGASMLMPGATLYLRQGRYHEEARIKNLRGNEDAPITIRPFKKEQVVIDGTVVLRDLNWSRHERYPNVWKAQIDQDVWQLFVDGRMMINARWPNAEHPFENEERSSWWDRSKSWCHVQYKIDGNVVSGFNFERAIGFLVEDGVKGLADTGRSFVGSMGVLNVNSMNTLVGRVSKHKAGSAAFEYEVNEQLQRAVRDPKQENLRRILTKNASHAYFYFEGWADMLDTLDEWAYDKETKRLFLHARSANELKGKEIRGKVQTVALLIEDCEFVVIKGFDFFGTALQVFDSYDINVEDNIFDYPSYSKRMLGSLEAIETISMMKSDQGRRKKKKRSKSKEFLASLRPDESITKLPRSAVAPEDGTYNIFRNNIVRYTDGMGLHLEDGGFDIVDNNLFRFVDISGTPGGSVAVTFNGWRNTFSRNTIEISCSSKATKAGAAGMTILNRVNRFGYLQDDGTAFQAAGAGQQGTIYMQNWVHDSPKSGLRFDGSEFADAYTRETLNGTMVRNVVFKNNGGLMVKGDDHRVYNNTCYNTQNDAFKILTSSESPHSNHDTVTRNNMGDYVNASRRDDPIENPPPGPTDHNWVNFYPQRDIRELLRDPDNLDFRPRPGAMEIIDSGVDIPSEKLRTGVVIPDFTSDFKVGDAPDIGAYEFGAKEYWIPGYRGPKASTPIPPNGTTTAKSDADLMWLPAYRAESCKVYLGTHKNALRLMAEQKNNIYDPGPLDPTAVYYWRVDCKTPEGWTEGDVWNFRARGRPFRQGGAFPSSYVEVFEEVYDFDPQNLEKNLQGLIMPWIHPKYNNDHLDIRGGVMEIIPDGNRASEFEAITIPNTNIDIERYPFVSFKYRTTDRKDPFGFYAGYTVFGGKARDTFPDEPLVILKPHFGDFKSVYLDLTKLVKQGKQEFGSAIAKNFLLQITGPGDVPWRKDDGALLISDFRIGFACLLDKVDRVEIAAQRVKIESIGQPVILSHEDLEIVVWVRGDKRSYTFPSNDPLPFDWSLRLAPGDNYTVVDDCVIKPAYNFKGTLRVSATIQAGEKSSRFLDIEVDVK